MGSALPIEIDPSWTHRLTVAQYHRMIDEGILGEDDKVELLEGVLVEMSPQEPPHARVITRLNRQLARSLGDDFEIRPQLPLTLTTSEPEPDLAVTDARRSWRRHPEAAYLVIEVAGDSLKRDRDVKARLYAEAGIHEYSIVDLDQACVHVLTVPDPGSRSYRTLRLARAGEVLIPSALPDVHIALDSLFT